ncbi:MBOAT family protein, partial [Eubacteriales bacterium OttesenSCG-928-N13]|nr:MBOAT family protein [Eubacteriales bacterium OttesenSCG-928-N13]
SLGSWFRDYVFFPLGGSRVKSKWRLAFNMFVVWSLTGLWHGADWAFLSWGVAFFVLLILEKLSGLGKWMENHWVGYVYTNIAVVVVTVLLGSAMHTDLSTAPPLEAITMAGHRMGALFGIGATSLWDSTASMYVREYGLFMLLAVLFSLPFGPWLEKKLHIPQPVSQIARAVGLVVVFLITISYIIMGGYSPFIYYNF